MSNKTTGARASGTYLANVRDQYEAFPFPKRDPADEKQRLHIAEYDYLGRINHYCFGGRRDFRGGFRAMVAGGGTGDALIFLAEQLRHRAPDAEVVYVDISSASMAIARERAAARGLDNIRWVQASILDLPNLDVDPVDYISCTGVLHHLADPDAGLAALSAVLAADGGMCLMVYGRYGRYGRGDIYTIQDLLRLALADEADLEARIDGAQAVLASLPERHPFFRGADPSAFLARFFEDRANVFDTFLHEQDRPYSVPELYDFVERQGLQLIAFTNFQRATPIYRIQYDPATYVNDADLLARICAQPLRQQQAIAEIIDGRMGLHTCYVSRRADAAAEPGDDMVPWLAYRELQDLRRQVVEGAQPRITLELKNGLTVGLERRDGTGEVFRAIDGRATVGEIVAAVADRCAGLDPDAARAEFLRIYRCLNDLDWLLLRDRTVPPLAPMPL